MVGMPGRSGRKKGTKSPVGKYREVIEGSKDLMAANLLPVTQGMVDAARGHYILMCQTPLGWQRVEDEAAADIAIKASMVRVYLTDPDIRAGLEVFDRIMGKVPQQINHETRHIIEQSVEDQAILVRILEEHVPAEHLAPVLAELRRIREHHREAHRLVAG